MPETAKADKRQKCAVRRAPVSIPVLLDRVNQRREYAGAPQGHLIATLASVVVEQPIPMSPEKAGAKSSLPRIPTKLILSILLSPLSGMFQLMIISV